MKNGYTEPHPVGIYAEAQMLESVAGFTDFDVERELAFAIESIDTNDKDTLLWAICLMARRIDDLEAAA